MHPQNGLLNTVPWSAVHIRQACITTIGLQQRVSNVTRYVEWRDRLPIHFASVENYRRQPRSMTEEDQNYGLLQHADNEIIISTSGKINRYVTVGLELLEVRVTELL